jgi:hypothetical protein
MTGPIIDLSPGRGLELGQGAALKAPGGLLAGYGISIGSWKGKPDPGITSQATRPFVLFRRAGPA